MERDEYDSARHACLSLDAFWELLHIFLLDVYAQRWHTGVDGVPARRWAESMQDGVMPALPMSAADVRMLLFPSAERTLQRYGVAVESLVYQSPALAALQWRLRTANRRIRLKIDPADVSHIYVLDPTDAQGWLKVPAVDQAYTAGLSRWKHRRIRRFVLQEQQRVDLYALAEAKARMQAIVEREFRLTRQSRTRKTAARLLEIGTGPAPSTGSSTDDPFTPCRSNELAAGDSARHTPAIDPVPSIPVEPPSLVGFGGDWGLAVPQVRERGAS